jgi:pSer/pThr/pTyr-binding forkhead associated (FHA) protein
VVLPFAAISKAHGFFRQEVEGRWVAGDLGSKNGTYVDGHKVNAHTTHPMRDGASLRFGDVTAKFLSPVSFVADLKRRL